MTHYLIPHVPEGSTSGARILNLLARELDYGRIPMASKGLRDLAKECDRFTSRRAESTSQVNPIHES